MKNILLFLSFIFLFAAANAQFIKNPSVEDLKKDQTLKQIIDNLPEGWEAKTDSTALYIFRKEKVWVPRENLKKLLACETCKLALKEPKVFNFNMDKRMCYHVEVFFKIVVSNVSNQEEIKKIKSNNAQLVSEVEKLKAKYKADELIVKYDLDESSTAVLGMSKSEIKSRGKYLSELAKLGYKPVPDYISEKYSLYVVSAQGDPLNEKSDPPGVNNEFNAIRALLKGYCEVPN